MEADGNVMISSQLDTRPVEQSLSDLKRTIKDAFKGNPKDLELALKQVNDDIKATESEARKAKTALRELMSGEQTPQSVKALQKELDNTNKYIEKLSKGYDKMLANVEKYKSAEGMENVNPQGAKKYEEAKLALEAYEKEIEAANIKHRELDAQIQSIKANPHLTPEAQKYNAILDQSKTKVQNLTEWQKYYENAVQGAARSSQFAGKSMMESFQKVEGRVMRLAKRVLFFSLITMGLRHLRKYIGSLISADSELSASLAQVKGNLATAFGSIWLTVLPALQAMAKWLAIATNYVAQFISWLTGKSFKKSQDTFKGAAAASGSAAKNTGKIGKAAKKAAKEAERLLLPFDQMNILTKDKAKDTAGAGGGGGGAPGGGFGGMEWPKQMDVTMAKLEMFKDLVMAIGAAFLAWKLLPLLGPLVQLFRVTRGLAELSKGMMFLALTAIIFGIFELISGIRSLIKEGPNVNNVCQIIAGALMTIGGAIILLTGATGLGLIIIAIGAVVLAFRHLYNTNKRFKKWVDTIIKLFKQGKWKEAGKMIIQGIYKGIIKAIKGVGKWIKKNIVDPFIKWIKKKFGISSPAKETMPLGEMITKGLLEGMLKPFKSIGKWIKDNIFTPIKDAFNNEGDGEDSFVFSIKSKFEDTKETLAAKWEDLKSGIKDTVTTLWTEVKEKVKGAIEKAKEAWDTLKDKTSTLWTEVKEKVAGAVDKVKQSWDALKDKTATLWTETKEKVAGAFDTLKTKWDGLKTRTAELWADVKEKKSGALDKVKNAFGLSSKKITLSTAVTGVKLKTLQTFAKTWNKIKFGAKTISLSFKDKFQAAYNSIASKIQNVRNKYPATKLILPDIHPLAAGAVIPANKQFLALLGDQKHGTNIETPLATMIDAFNTALQANGLTGEQVVNVYLQGDAKQLFRVVRTEANNYTQSTGKAAFNL